MNKKLLTALVSLFAVASSVFAATGMTQTASAQTIDNDPDCDTVAIVKCGVFSQPGVRTAAAKGDVAKVYAAFGIKQSELGGFVEGVVWKDGRVTVGDKVVATGATTAGRWNNPKSGMTRISGTDRAYKMSTSNFVTDGQTAFIKMVDGQFAFAIIKSCGNPVTAKPTPKPPTPAYACSSLRASQTSRTSLTVRFTTTASASGGAKITNYRYDYGDGKTETIPAPGPSHTYAKAGTYTTKVTVLVSVNGKTVEATDAKCAVKVTIETPPKEECRPGIPKGDKRCEEKEECKPGIPVGDDRCKETPPPVTPPETPKTPDVLPDTGPAGIVFGGLGLSSVAGAGYYWRTSRRKLVDSLLKRK